MYNHGEIEKKWQRIWKNEKVFQVSEDKDKPKYYILVEFPYPSGVGLHVGHVRSYTALDAVARKKRMDGLNVLFPMGWDAFGSPAEQYAIKHNVHPSIAVTENIKTFKGQIESLGISIDWNREINTSNPEYYKWTQWQFLKFFEHNMAYKAKKNINWCPTCKSGLSNEEASGGVCERCGTPVTQKEKSQWVLRMSDYAEDLIDGLNDTKFHERIKLGQINWIGKSVGAEVNFGVTNTHELIKVFTTRIDTIYGATFVVMAPEHPLINKMQKEISNYEEIEKYINLSKSKTEFERIELNKDKTGVLVEGIKAINPITNTEIPIFVADYVMMNYGTGAIMAVPAHDDRDYEFARKFNIPIIQVLESVTGTPNKNETHKDSIVAVLYDEKNNKYLTVNWHEKGGRLFIGGTRRDGESASDCAKREIIEETGYDDIELIYEGPKINHHYYAFNKDKYFVIDSTSLLFKLKSEHNVSQNLDDDDETFDLEWVTKEVIENEIKDELHKKTFACVTNRGPMIEDGIHINSDMINGMNKEDAINKMIDYIEKNNIGNKKVNYRLQDWVFSRQRFWGEPIPIINCEHCGFVPVPESDLPVVLPDIVNFEPNEDGESPLANIEEWVNVKCPKCGKNAKRETDTMPNWAGSSWYFLRYMDAFNKQEFASKDNLKYWGKVDWYNGGMEHTTRHLLYARFWNQFLYNIGLVPNKEPFDVRVSHGMILGSNGVKMSKSLGNVINPDDVVNTFGADTLRTYEMFIGDYEKDASWSTDSLNGCKRFLDRVWKLKDKLNDKTGYTDEIIVNKTIKKVSFDIENMKYNTIISALMILSNTYDKLESITKDDYRILLHLLNPIAPHITEELNEICDLGKRFTDSKWPTYDEEKTIENDITIGIQINGKLRSEITVLKDEDKESIEKRVLESNNIKSYIEGKEIVKIIVIPNRIVNIVVK